MTVACALPADADTPVGAPGDILGRDRGNGLDDLRRRVVVRAAAWSYRTEHVPVPLVIVNVAPEFEQVPELENVTAPAGAVAATVSSFR